MAMNISCKFEKASYNIFFVRAVTVKSLYTLRRRRNEVKSIVSTGCYPVDTIKNVGLGIRVGDHDPFHTSIMHKIKTKQVTGLVVAVEKVA